MGLSVEVPRLTSAFREGLPDAASGAPSGGGFPINVSLSQEGSSSERASLSHEDYQPISAERIPKESSGDNLENYLQYPSRPRKHVNFVPDPSS